MRVSTKTGSTAGLSQEHFKNSLPSINPQPYITVVIPAYNEAKRIPTTLREISRYFEQKKLTYEILVIDDGSSDETGRIVGQLSIPNSRVLNYGANRGKGFAVNFGVQAAEGQWILIADADNSTPIDQFDRLWRETDKDRVIIGSRYLGGSSITVRQSLLRVILGRLGNLLVQLLLLPGIKDSQCGFKLFEAGAAKKIFALQTIWRWGFDMEVLRIAKEQGLKIKEVPITWRNDDQSRIQSSRVFVKTLGELLTIKKNSLLGHYGHDRSTLGLFWRFAIVGAIGTVLDFTVLNITHRSFGLDLGWALTLGFLSGAINNYLMNSYWTFRQSSSWHKWGKFLIIAGIGLLFNNGIVLLLANSTGWNYNLAKLVALVVVFFWNFLANKSWTFDRASGSR